MTSHVHSFVKVSPDSHFPVQNLPYGPTSDARGCLELTLGGKQPLVLKSGAVRRFIEDGDRMTMSGWCQGDGYRVGFGEVTGRLLT